MNNKAKKAKYKVTIKKEWCKNCGICVAFCPKEVFICEGMEKPVVKFSEYCINCTLCVLRCPDFAVTVEPEEREDN